MMISKDWRAFAKDYVLYVGETIGLLVGPDRTVLKYLKDKIHIEYEAEEPAVTIDDGISSKGGPMFPEKGNNVFCSLHCEKGRPMEEVFAEARQAVHFNGETGEHPNVVHAHHVLEAETVFSGVHRSAAEEQIAHTSPRKIAQAVLCEGFDGEGITTCAMTHFSVGLNVRWMIMRAKVKVLTQKK